MLGIVGNLVIEFSKDNKKKILTVDLSKEKSFILDIDEKSIKMDIDEITYIIDTIYGVDVSHGDDCWCVSGNEKTEFIIESEGISGTMRLSFEL